MGGSLHCVLSSKRGGSSRDARRHGLCHVEGLFLGIVEELLNDSPRSCSYKLLVTNRLNNPVCGQGLGIRICTVKYHAQKVMARTNGRRKISLISDQREALSEALSRKFQHWTRETLSVRKGFNLGNFNTGHGKRCQFGKGSIWEISTLDTGNAVSSERVQSGKFHHWALAMQSGCVHLRFRLPCLPYCGCFSYFFFPVTVSEHGTEDQRILGKLLHICSLPVGIPAYLRITSN